VSWLDLGLLFGAAGAGACGAYFAREALNRRSYKGMWTGTILMFAMLEAASPVMVMWFAPPWKDPSLYAVSVPLVAVGQFVSVLFLAPFSFAVWSISQRFMTSQREERGDRPSGP
jgi:hypothetical protein